MKSFLMGAALAVCVMGSAAAQVTDLGPGDLNEPLPGGRLDVEGQRAGLFGSMVRQEAPGGAVQEAWDDFEPGGAVFVENWSPLREMRMRVREGMVSTVILPDWEDVRDYALSDNFNFQARPVKDAPNMIWVWAVNPGYDTNINIIGESGNVYVIYLRGETFNSLNLPDLAFHVRAAQPLTLGDGGTALVPAVNSSDELVAAAAAKRGSELSDDGSGTGKPEWLVDVPFDPTEVKHDRELRGDAEIAPKVVFRDERFTYLDYSDRASDWPAAYQVKDGVDSPVRTRVSKDGRFLVVESVLPLTLRLGEQVVCVKPASSSWF